MTTNHHNAIANGAAANATIFEAADGALDSAITDLLDATLAHSKLLVGSGSIDATAIAEFDSTTLGFLPPRMTTTQRDLISSPADGLLIYNTTTNQLEFSVSSAWAAVGAVASSIAILRDEKTTGTDGGSCSTTTWNARDLNTEVSDDDSIVSIASNQFTPIAGDFLIDIWAQSLEGANHRLRLFNVTGVASVQEGIGSKANSAGNTSSMVHLVHKFTANGTDAYRIDHFTAVAQATDGLGIAISDGSAEVYMEIKLEKLS